MPPRRRTSSRSKVTTPPRASRPHMPGYGLPAARAGLLPWTWADRRLRQSHNYWIMTVRPDARPHAMPVWGIWVDNRFYFSTGRESRKARNLRANRSCIVCSENAAEAVIVEGTAAEVTDGSVLERLAPYYYRKYKPWKLDTAAGPVFEVRPGVIFGLREKTFKAATRWMFRLFRSS